MPAVSAPHPEAPLLTALELAERTGTDPALIERLIGLSILTPGEEERAFGAGDFQRVRFAVALERAGISLDRVGQAIADGHLSFAFMDLQWGHVWGRLAGGSYREICDSFGLPVDLVLRVHAGIGLPPVGPDDQIREDDTEVLPAIASMRAVGMDEATILRVTRVYGENIRRIAQAEAGFYHSYIEMPMLRSGMPERQMRELAATMSLELQPLAERVLLWLYRRHQEHFIVEDLIEHVEAAMEEAGLGERRPVGVPAMCFLDLAGYTRLTEERGDDAAAELAAALAQLVQGAATRYGGIPVKWLGDGVMFHFPDPGQGVLCALEMVERTPEAGLPAAHVGVNAGPVIVRDGDYFGRTVNVAARIAGRAGPGEVLVSEDLLAAAKPDGVRFEGIGPADLKGLTRPVTLYRASRA